VIRRKAKGERLKAKRKKEGKAIFEEIKIALPIRKEERKMI
jgi:hypothetical protein